MGHQVRFYATPDDVRTIEERLRRLEPLVILHNRSSTAAPRHLPHLDHTENGQQWLFFHLVREADADAVVCKHVPTQGYWAVDVLRSPVVEFERGYFDGTMIRPGRVYCVDGFYDIDGTWMEKPEGFRAWSGLVLNTIRKLCTKQGAKYIAPAALRCIGTQEVKLAD